MKSIISRLRVGVGLLALSGAVFTLSGCSANFGGSTGAADQVHMQSISGIVHGGQQGLVGAQVFLYAVGTGGYGSASTLVAGPVTTDSSGNFSFSSGFNCTAGQQLYLYALGGDPELGQGGTASGNNPGAGLLAVAGHCTGGTGITNSQGATIGAIFMDEVSTIATAYSLAAYATDATHIGRSGTALAATNLSNAIDTSFNLVNPAAGTALSAPLSGNGTVPATEINTLADMLASCINSTGGPCSSLFANAMNGSAAPTDTATAAINIAHNPIANISALLNLTNNASPFQPILTTATSFTLAVNYTGGGLANPVGIAVDATGNIWLANQANGTTPRLSEFNHIGVPVSATGFTGGGLALSQNVALDPSGNVWVSNTEPNLSINNLSKFTPAGTPISGANGFTGGGLVNPIGLAITPNGNAWTANDGSGPSEFNGATGAAISPASGFPLGGVVESVGIAIDPAGDVWIAGIGSNAVSKLSGSTGALLSPAGGFTGGGLDAPWGLAFDTSSNIWVANHAGNSLSKFNGPTGAALTGTEGIIGGGLSAPQQLAIDGSENLWTANTASGVNSVTELNSAGTPLSPPAGFTGGPLKGPTNLALDGSGNVWVASDGGNTLTEFIGAATPVVTPLVANFLTGTKTAGQKP
jgi:hypothetical protein